MKTIFPIFYKDFSCKAGDCRHSCCRGWEIDIDEETAKRYFSDESPFGEKLRANIQRNADGVSFRLTEDERCPFLREDGLCHIILERGEEELCEICSMHPRFFTYYEDFELAGVGLCCEKSCELLLGSDDVLLFDTEAEDALFTFSGLLEILGFSVESLNLKWKPSGSGLFFRYVLDIMKKTEPINKEWTEKLACLEESERMISEKVCGGVSYDTMMKFQKIYEMILYRQIEKADVYSFNELTNFAGLNTEFILYEYIRTENLAESLRSWSEQIEYDTDNVELLLKFLKTK